MSFSRSTAHLAMIVAGATLLLSGCTAQPDETPSTPAPEQNFQRPPEPAKFHPDGSAEQNLPFFSDTLQSFAEGAEPVQGVPLVETIAAAGFDKAAMQVSFDESKTGLTADSLFVSVRIAQDCLIGQVTTADRSTASYVVPAVGPEETICLIGNTRVIDW